MRDMDVKKKILNEIMGLMDEKEGENLKMKSPKFMAAKIEVEKPESPAEDILKEKMGGEEKEMEHGSESKESPEMESSEEMSPEMIQKLLEMYKDMK